MFERFTDRARRSVVLAQEESRLLRHNYIGCEHILLGVVNFAIEDLAPDGFTRAGLRDAVMRAIAAAPAPAPEDTPSVWRIRPAAGDPQLRELEARLRELRRAKDEAIERRDIESAVFLREEEKALLANQANAVRRYLDSTPSTMVRGRVYISYRPEDEGVAGRLYDGLV